MDWHRAIESCNIESCNDDRLDSKKLDCHALQSKARNDDKIDSNPIQNLDSIKCIPSPALEHLNKNLNYFRIHPLSHELGSEMTEAIP